jgi:hypothetical protein
MDVCRVTLLQQLKALVDAAVLALERERAAAEGVRVPDSDLTPHSEPTTVSGWYQQGTRSGRAAWQYRYWKSGRLLCNRPVYDRVAVDQFEMAAWAWREAKREYQEELLAVQIKSALLGGASRATVKDDKP